jgi:hypothetical protein
VPAVAQAVGECPVGFLGCEVVSAHVLASCSAEQPSGFVLVQQGSGRQLPEPQAARVVRRALHPLVRLRVTGEVLDGGCLLQGQGSGVDFGQASFPQDVPVVEMSAESAAALVTYIEAEAAAGRQVTLTVTTSTVSEVRQSENVIAQTTTGRTDRVVVSGAHLDSVIEGPGINDNGSGSAAQLEVALQMAKLGIEPVNQVRFIWFGAEEAGLVGSAYYVSQLTKRQLKDIAVMLNFDMVGSPNAGWFVYDGDASDTASTGSTGSGVVEDVFVDFFESIGRATEPTAFDGRSDYDAFVAAGIPAGGLFTAAA